MTFARAAQTLNDAVGSLHLSPRLLGSMAAQKRRAVDFSQIQGLRVGHAQDPTGQTGVSVVRFDRSSPVVIDVRGGASATYDTGSLNLEATFGRRWAIFFSGGSLYGLDAARGIRTRLLEEGVGQRAFGGEAVVVPVSGAAIFDIYAGRLPKADYQALGYAAARDASRSSAVRAGSIGAGCGARVGKYLGPSRTMAGGVGSAAAPLAGGGRIGVLAVVNAVGAIRDPFSGEFIAGARSRRGTIVPPTSRALAHVGRTHTTLALVATDLLLSRPELFRLAMITSTGLARAIVPFHTTTDGDMVFAASTERVARRGTERRPGEVVDRIGIAAADLAVEAVLAAVSRGP